MNGFVPRKGQGHQVFMAESSEKSSGICYHGSRVTCPGFAEAGICENGRRLRTDAVTRTAVQEAGYEHQFQRSGNG